MTDSFKKTHIVQEPPEGGSFRPVPVPLAPSKMDPQIYTLIVATAVFLLMGMALAVVYFAQHKQIADLRQQLDRSADVVDEMKQTNESLVRENETLKGAVSQTQDDNRALIAGLNEKITSLNRLVDTVEYDNSKKSALIQESSEKIHTLLAQRQSISRAFSRSRKSK